MIYGPWHDRWNVRNTLEMLLRCRLRNGVKSLLPPSGILQFLYCFQRVARVLTVTTLILDLLQFKSRERWWGVDGDNTTWNDTITFVVCMCMCVYTHEWNKTLVWTEMSSHTYVLCGPTYIGRTKRFGIQVSDRTSVPCLPLEGPESGSSPLSHSFRTGYRTSSRLIWEI